MLRPSYSELMQVLNNDPDLDNKITSRYAVVITAAKRARQLIDGAEPLAVARTDKAVSIAVNEMNAGFIRINPEGDYETDTEEKEPAASYYDKTGYAESYDDFGDDDVELLDDSDEMTDDIMEDELLMEDDFLEDEILDDDMDEDDEY